MSSPLGGEPFQASLSSQLRSARADMEAGRVDVTLEENCFDRDAGTNTCWDKYIETYIILVMWHAGNDHYL